RLKDAGVEPVVIFGSRTAPDKWLCDRFESECKLYICTDDGSAGFHGLVTQHPEFNPGEYDFVQICGPKPMMMACAAIAGSVGVSTEVSLENHMACGLGACLCCVEDTRNGNVCVCKDGPVFNINELQW
ncbi:MAG: dihydroorotate dehydrogenase electron transfer subunit, partial [Muribaculaceae bacterium]|nr:dihydroorotate dehydrogenase electron transfer subunit [Muribaculaceae bacterium]